MDFIPKSEWTEFCDRFTRSLEGLRAEIEVASLDLGNQIEARSLPILGISYDRKDEVLAVALEGITHLINGPQELHVEISPSGVAAMAIRDKEGTRHLLKFTRPLALPHAEEMPVQMIQPTPG